MSARFPPTAPSRPRLIPQSLFTNPPNGLPERLIEACITGELRRVNAVMKMSADPTQPSANGQLPLAAAIWGGNIAVVQRLEELISPNPAYWQQCLEQNQNRFGAQYPTFEPNLQYTAGELQALWKSHLVHLLKADWLRHPEDLLIDGRYHFLQSRFFRDGEGGPVIGELLSWHYFRPGKPTLSYTGWLFCKDKHACGQQKSSGDIATEFKQVVTLANAAVRKLEAYVDTKLQQQAMLIPRRCG